MSADPLQEYFSDGITEDIITELSKISGLFVIARHSAFTYKGKSVTLRQVGQELGVRYVLEGSVRRGGNRLRITAQLIDAGTDHHLWAERYDREIEDMFAVQDEVSQKVAEALEIALTPGEQQYVPRPYTDNQEAYDLFLRGRAYQVGSTKERTAESRRLFKKAIALDPNFASAYALLSHTHWRDWRNQWREGSASLELAFHAAEKAVALDNTLPLAHVYLAWVNVFKRQYEQAIAGARRAVSLDPNFAEGYARLGHIDTLAGSSPEEGIEHIRKAMRLDPHYPSNYLIYLGHAYYVMEKYEEAVSALKRAVTRSPDNTHSSLLLALIYTELGDPDMAREHVAEVLRVSPRTTIRSRNEGMPFKDPAMAARFSKALRNSGLPE
jgi:adenylate cyclase